MINELNKVRIKLSFSNSFNKEENKYFIHKDRNTSSSWIVIYELTYLWLVHVRLFEKKNKKKIRPTLIKFI